MYRNKKTSFSMTIGTLISASLAISTAQADVNPFIPNEFSQASLLLAGVVPAEVSDAKPSKADGEMKCGATMSGQQKGAMKGNSEMSCGAMMSGQQMGEMKGNGEMSCGAMMQNMPEGMSMDEKTAMCQRKMSEQQK